MEPGLVTAKGQLLGVKEFTQEVPTGTSTENDMHHAVKGPA